MCDASPAHAPWRVGYRLNHDAPEPLRLAAPRAASAQRPAQRPGAALTVAKMAAAVGGAADAHYRSSAHLDDDTVSVASAVLANAGERERVMTRLAELEKTAADDAASRERLARQIGELHGLLRARARAA